MKRDAIFFLVIAILLFMLFRECHRSEDGKVNAFLKGARDSAAFYKRQSDSNYESYAKVTIEAMDAQAAYNDSIIKLNRTITDLYSQNDFASIRVKNLIAAAREAAEKTNDTAMLMRIDQAERLAAEHDGIVAYLKSTGSRKDSLYAAEITNFTMVQSKKDSLYTELHGHFNQIYSLNESLSNKFGKLERSNSKRFVVGPYLGYGITGVGKLQPSVGISITYQFFKF